MQNNSFWFQSWGYTGLLFWWNMYILALDLYLGLKISGVLGDFLSFEYVFIVFFNNSDDYLKVNYQTSRFYKWLPNLEIFENNV